MAERNLSIRLSVKDADTVKRALQGLGKDGQDALRKIEAGAPPASKGLLAVNAVAGDLRGTVGGLTGSLGPLGSGLSALGIAGAAGAVGIAAAIAALGILYTKGKEALSFADDIGDVADKLHITAEQLQELRFAFTGLVEPQAVDAGLTTFTRNLGLAEAGNKKAQVSFKALHMELKDGNGQYKSNAVALAEVIDRIAALKSPEEQLAITMKLLGDEMAAGLPAIRQGNEFFKDRADQLRAMGGLITNDDIARAGQFQQVLDDLSVVVKAQLVQGFLIAAPQIVAFTKLIGENLPKVIEGGAHLVKFLADNLTTLAEVAATTAGVIAGGLIGSALGPLGTILGAVTGGYVGMKVAVDQLEGSQRTYNDLADKAKQITTDLTTASGARKDALEAERRNLVALAEAELQRADAALQAKQSEMDAAEHNVGSNIDPEGYALVQTATERVGLQKRRDTLRDGLLLLRADSGQYDDGARGAIPSRTDAPTTSASKPATNLPSTLGSLGTDTPPKEKGDPYGGQMRDLQASLALQLKLNDAYDKGSDAVGKITRELELQQKINAISDKYTPQQKADVEARLRQLDAEQLRGKVLQKGADIGDQVALQQKELDLAGETETVRTRELAVFRAKLDLQKMGVDLASDEAKRVLDSTAKQVDLNTKIAQQKDLYSELGDLAGGAFDRIGAALTQLSVNNGAAAVDFQAVWSGVLSELEQSFIRLAVLNPLKNALGLNDGKTLPDIGSIGGFLGQGLSFLGGLIGGGTPAIYPGSTTVGPTGTLGHNAVGNIYGPSGKMPAFALGGAFDRYGVVNRPTLFPFAGGTGLMGEAGPEAIVPLQRLPDGKLGIGAANQNGGGQGKVEINVHDQVGVKVKASETRDGRGNRSIELTLADMWAQEAGRPGSSANKGVAGALAGPTRR